MTRAELRLELLRIASAAAGRDDKLALDIAQAWEPWVLEAFEPEAQASAKKSEKKA